MEIGNVKMSPFVAVVAIVGVCGVINTVVRGVVIWRGLHAAEKGVNVDMVGEDSTETD